MTGDTVLHAVQLAVAPVFMLAAVAGMIGTLAGRLARIIDRARVLHERVEANTARDPDTDYREMALLRRRGMYCNASIGFLAVSGVLIGATVMSLFLGETWVQGSERLVPWTFLSAVACFVVALLLFLRETLLATHTLNFVRLKAPGSDAG
jgi:hypothetical protein